MSRAPDENLPVALEALLSKQAEGLMWDTLTSTVGIGAQVIASCCLSFSDYKFDDDVGVKN